MKKVIRKIDQVKGINDYSNAVLQFINGNIDFNVNEVWVSQWATIPGPAGGGFSIGCLYHDLENAIIVSP